MFYLDISPSIQKPHVPAITEWLVYMTLFFVQGREASCANNHWMTCVHDSVFCPGSRGLLCQQSLNDLCTRLCFLSRVARPLMPAITEWLVYMTVFFVQGCEASYASNHWMTCVHDCVFCPGLRGLLCQQSLNDLCTWLCFLSRVARPLVPTITEWLVYTTVFFVQGRELLMRMLEVFVLKFKTIARIQLPQILAKWLVKYACTDQYLQI